MSDSRSLFVQTSDAHDNPKPPAWLKTGWMKTTSDGPERIVIEGSEDVSGHSEEQLPEQLPGLMRSEQVACADGGDTVVSTVVAPASGWSSEQRRVREPDLSSAGVHGTSRNSRARPGATERQQEPGVGHRVPLLRPDMPPAAALWPYLQRMDQAGWYTNFGPLVGEFEERVGDSLAGADDGAVVRVATTSSGTAALELAMAALALRPGTRVLVPAFNFPAAATAARRLGHEPVLCDVDAATWILSPEIARAVCSRFDIGLVIPVATFGRPLAVDAWDAFTAETDIPVLIDAAAAFDEQRIGRRTTVAFSFHATKPFGIGEGGLVATGSERVAQRVRRLSNFGFLDGVVRESGGGNGKLSEYHAAVGLAQLERWAEIKQRRRRLALQYAQELAFLGGRVCLQQGWGRFGPANLTVALGESAVPDDMSGKLDAAGVETRRWYCPALTEHPAFRRLPRASLHEDRLPVCEALCQCTLGLPFHSCMTAADVSYVCRQLNALIYTGRG